MYFVVICYRPIPYRITSDCFCKALNDANSMNVMNPFLTTLEQILTHFIEIALMMVMGVV